MRHYCFVGGCLDGKNRKATGAHFYIYTDRSGNRWWYKLVGYGTYLFDQVKPAEVTHNEWGEVAP